MCLAVDLFEVIAELAGLDLERPDQCAEAATLSEHAQSQLMDASVAGGPPTDANEDESARSDSAP